MALVFLDLDETLLDGDSDYEWGRYLATTGKVDRATYEKENERFYREYLAGTFDILKFLDFALKPLAENSYAELCRWRSQFIETRIRPMIKAKAHELIRHHREAGDELVIITSTNRFIVEPICELLGIENLIATEPAQENGEFTGAVEGVPCFGPGKVTRANQWADSRSKSLQDSYFYTDSFNDLPLLEHVGFPVAVDADEKLAAHANKLGWKQISLKS
ncbi:MAG: HAD family hydrolase [Proteobacteria bacterium]|nr:HAD family hydrolase [Pseudomonadota bacterium]